MSQQVSFKTKQNVHLLNPCHWMYIYQLLQIKPMNVLFLSPTKIRVSINSQVNGKISKGKQQNVICLMFFFSGFLAKPQIYFLLFLIACTLSASLYSKQYILNSEPAREWEKECVHASGSAPLTLSVVLKWELTRVCSVCCCPSCHFFFLFSFFLFCLVKMEHSQNEPRVVRLTAQCVTVVSTWMETIDCALPCPIIQIQNKCVSVKST